MVREHERWNRWPDFVFEAADGTDISELYLLADLLITDYSSAMFDYSLLGRPMYFFAYDLEAYPFPPAAGRRPDAPFPGFR